MTWNWRPRRARLLLGVAMLACGLALTHPLEAHAAWPLEGSAATLLGFGATYRATDATASAVHHGVDLAAEEGDAVLAPLAGTVTFVGSVPAVGGGRVRAMTISTAEGSLTLLPLERTEVPKGAEVAEGDVLGRLGTGDGSSASAHLHVGLKRGELYLDPLSVLALAPPAAGQAPDASAASAASEAGAGEPAGVAVAPGVSVRAAGHAGSLAPAAAAAPASLRAPVPGARLAPGVSVAGATAPAAAGAAAAPLGGSAAAQAALGSAATRPAAAHAASRVAHALTVRELAARVASLAVGYARTLALGLLGMLASLGALWPLWRRREEEGLGEERVSAFEEDVAAAVGRWYTP